MNPEFDMKSLVAMFPSAMVRKRPQPGVYEIKTTSKQGRAHRIAFVEQLFERFPIRLIWLKDLDGQMRENLGVPLSTSAGSGIWKLPSTASPKKLLDGLYEGGWAMFFLPSSYQEVPKTPEFLPTNPEEVILLLSAFSADVAIISWYDDAEWIIVSSPQLD